MKWPVFLIVSAIGTIPGTADNEFPNDWSKFHYQMVGTPTHWELYAYKDKYNVHEVLKRLNNKVYMHPEDCVKDAEKLPPPPPAEGEYIYGYICHKVEGTDPIDT